MKRETGGSPAASDESNVKISSTVVRSSTEIRINLAPHTLEMLDKRPRTLMKKSKLLLNKLHIVVLPNVHPADRYFFRRPRLLREATVNFFIGMSLRLNQPISSHLSGSRMRGLPLLYLHI